MTSTEHALPVSLAAIDALESADLTWTDETPEDAVRAVAGPVLAAWVEQVAAEWDDQQWSTTPRAMAKVLREALADVAVSDSSARTER